MKQLIPPTSLFPKEFFLSLENLSFFYLIVSTERTQLEHWKQDKLKYFVVLQWEPQLEKFILGKKVMKNLNVNPKTSPKAPDLFPMKCFDWQQTYSIPGLPNECLVTV